MSEQADRFLTTLDEAALELEPVVEPEYSKGGLIGSPVGVDYATGTITLQQGEHIVKLNRNGKLVSIGQIKFATGPDPSVTLKALPKNVTASFSMHTNEARGLMQIINPTFDSYKAPKLWDGYTTDAEPTVPQEKRADPFLTSLADEAPPSEPLASMPRVTTPEGRLVKGYEPAGMIVDEVHHVNSSLIGTSVHQMLEQYISESHVQLPAMPDPKPEELLGPLWQDTSPTLEVKFGDGEWHDPLKDLAIVTNAYRHGFSSTLQAGKTFAQKYIEDQQAKITAANKRFDDELKQALGIQTDSFEDEDDFRLGSYLQEDLSQKPNLTSQSRNPFPQDSKFKKRGKK